MMRRPVDQAKLLFLYFLRSSAGLASEPMKSAVGNAVKSTQQQQAVDAMGGHICLRIARRGDVPAIQRCNLATLPENYNSNFYANHMRQWPELALVAEHVPEGDGASPRRGRSRVTDRGTNNNRSNKYNLASGYDPGQKSSKIIGYVLGKVEEQPVRVSSPSSSSPLIGIEGNEEYYANRLAASIKKKERLGHVTSIAILNDYRRKGLAVQLMNQLHHEMKHRYNANAIDLHVRVSNESAFRLYSMNMGYKVEDIIPNYYQNPMEDAYLMRKVVANNQDVNDPTIIDRELQETVPTITNGGVGGGGRGGDLSEFVRNFRFVPKIGSSRSHLYSTSRDNDKRSSFGLPRVVLNLGEDKDVEVSENDLESTPSAVTAASPL